MAYNHGVTYVDITLPASNLELPVPSPRVRTARCPFDGRCTSTILRIVITYHARMARRAQHLRCYVREANERTTNWITSLRFARGAGAARAKR